jgi:hypothetical protein
MGVPSIEHPEQNIIDLLIIRLGHGWLGGEGVELPPFLSNGWDAENGRSAEKPRQNLYPGRESFWRHKIAKISIGEQVL